MSSLPSIRITLALSTLTAAGALLFAPSVAYAGVESCGNIDVRAEAQCKVEVKETCTAKCTPVTFEAACAGKLEVQCDGQCNATADVECTGSCQADCKGKCEANPGSFDCQGSCEGSCSADCSGKCASNANKSECEASCKATCSGSCSAKCEGTPPSATCDAKCQGSCSGSCEGKANIDCQVQCQSKGYVDCKANLKGGCEAKCSEPEGALFCDGQYVDTGGHLQDCINSLNAFLKSHVDASASGSAECSGNQCNAEGEAKASCSSISPVTTSTHGDGAFFVLGALGVVGAVAARRRRDDKRAS